MKYESALAYLYGYIRNSQGGFLRDTPYEVATARIRALLDLLGNPQAAYPTLHIAGTKGKGSVSAMCAAMLSAGGYRVGLYTSPHLQDIRERFKVGDTLIPADTFAYLVEKIAPALEAVEKPTYYEAVTLLAFTYFREAGVDVAVIETGVGGLLDATNVILPRLSVITTLGMDHMKLLGDTLEDIAWAKAGIIKPGTPVISAPQPEAALRVIEAVARDKAAPLTLIGRDWRLESDAEQGATCERFRAAPIGQPLRTYQTPLLGAHQAVNGAVALAAIAQLSASGLPVSEADAAAGLRAVNWPGRMEVITREGATQILLDSAHNLDSALRLKETLLARFPRRPRVLVFGAKGSKDIETMLDILLPAADGLVLTQSSDTITEVPELLAGLAAQIGYTGQIHTAADVPTALALAEQVAGPDGMICVTGSVYIVGEARTACGLTPGRAAYLG